MLNEGKVNSYRYDVCTNRRKHYTIEVSINKIISIYVFLIEKLSCYQYVTATINYYTTIYLLLYTTLFELFVILF